MTALRVLLSGLVAICVSTPTEQLSMFQTAEIISAHGYPSETHHVTTSDGYILEMHRIPHGIGQSPSAYRPVVFLMHGLTAASNFYIMTGPELAPAYNLADAGFDIWLGNARGNRNSRFHVSLDPDDPAEKFPFFDFTFEEIGIFDLPIMIDYVLQYTGHEKLHYIGHSQGGVTFLILNSLLPEYNEKILSAHLLASGGYFEHFPDEQVARISQHTDTLYSLALRIGFVEVFPPKSDVVPAAERLSHCTGNETTSYMCGLVGVRHLVRDVTQNALDNIFDDYVSAGASTKQYAHYGQNTRDKSFRRYSHGTSQNMDIYGSIEPPLYDLSLVSVNTTLHYSINDAGLDEKDVISTANAMQNASVRRVARDTFLHDDFVIGLDAKEQVTDYIIEALRRDSGLTDVEGSTIAPVTGSAHYIIFNNVLKMILLSFYLLVL